MAKIMEYSKERRDLALLDNDFLVALQTQKQREIYARVTSLNINELPIDSIEGLVTGGSINIDGSSSVRRTCNLTMVAESIDINDIYWGVKTKVRIEIGLKNNLTNEYQANNQTYPSIMWFPQGIYFLTSFNTQIQAKGYTITLNGKDKMCILNGELGGQLFASIDFGKEEYAKKIFKPVAVGEGSSEVFLGGKYYFKPNINDIPDIISDTDEMYSFAQETEGEYYRVNNTYRKLKSIPNNQQNAINSKVKYKVYQKAMTPYQIFEEVTLTDDTYEKNKYYYLKDHSKDYYILNMTSTKKDHNYKVIELFEPDVEYTIKSVPIERIIREAVHTYAKEPYHNIIINDLDKYGLEQLTYKNEKESLYGLYDSDAQGFIQLFFRRNLEKCRIKWHNSANEEDPWQTSTIGQLLDNSSFQPVVLSEINNNNQDYTHLQFLDGEDKLGKINAVSDENFNPVYGIREFKTNEDIGYRLTELTYTGDLISSIGESLTSILDKIKNMLGEFEYFYDVEGHFIFQKKKTFVNTSWDQLTESNEDIFVDVCKTKFVFNFQNNNLITAIQNQPVLTNLKNDFSVWGKRKGISGEDIPIHARYAIDRKPKVYKAFDGILYYTQDFLDDDYRLDKEEKINNILDGWSKNENIIPDELKNYDENGQLIYEGEGKERHCSDWYELSNWAEKYKLLTGVYPSQKLFNYGTTGYKGTLNFADGTTRTFTGVGQLIIDYDKTKTPMVPIHSQSRITIVNGHSYITFIRWSPFQHGFNGCFHTYEQFLGYYHTTKNFISFIYKPELPPAEIIAADGGSIQTTGEDAKLVDWREIIYQMAKDYFAGQGCDKTSLDYHPIYNIKGELVLDDVDHFLSTVARLNPKYYPSGYTGYEQYYTDMEGFWRQLYNPDYVPVPQFKLGEYITTSKTDPQDYFTYNIKTWKSNEHYEEIQGNLNNAWTYYLKTGEDSYTIFKDDPQNIETNNGNALRYYHVWEKVFNNETNVYEKGAEYYSLIFNSATQIQEAEEGQYYHNLKNDTYIKLYVKVRGIEDYLVDYYFTDDDFLVKNQRIELTSDSTDIIDADAKDKYNKYYIPYNESSDLKNRKYWNINVFDNPESLNFWIEFLDDGNELAQFSVPMVGDRSSSINEDKASAIVFKDIPELIINPSMNVGINDKEKTGWIFDTSKFDEYLKDQTGYTFVYLPPGFEQYFSISYRSLSVKNKVDEMLYKYAYCIENITLTALPIYHLEPNTVIYVQDKTTGIEGEYIINKITLPLDYKGTMSIQAVKSPQRLY